MAACEGSHASWQAEAHNQVSSARTLVSGALEAWGPYDAFPLAAIRSSLGQAGELATETKVRWGCLILAEPQCKTLCSRQAPFCQGHVVTNPVAHLPAQLNGQPCRACHDTYELPTAES